MSVLVIGKPQFLYTINLQISGKLMLKVKARDKQSNSPRIENPQILWIITLSNKQY